MTENTPFVVREFDKIFSGEETNIADHTLCKKDFNSLKDTIYNLYNDKSYEELSLFFKVGNKKGFGGPVITTCNYVGVVQLPKSETVIEILPKITLSQSTDKNVIEETKNIFTEMIGYMYNFKAPSLDGASLRISEKSLFEIFISMFLKELENVMRGGLHSYYTSVEDNINVFKGKLIISEHIKKNTAHLEKFYMRFDEFSHDIAENQIIKMTLQHLKHKSIDSGNQRRIRQYLDLLNEVKTIYKWPQNIIMNRTNEKYRKILRWSELFCANKSFSPFSGEEDASAILFPMEKVFETYIYEKIKQYVQKNKDNGYCKKIKKVSKQVRGKFLFDEPPKFTLKPDIIIETKDDKLIIMDTKWKRIKTEKDISQGDMYQMFAYAHRYNTSNIWLIYPCTEDKYSDIDIFKSSCANKFDVHIHLFFIDIEKIEDSISELLKLITH